MKVTTKQWGGESTGWGRAPSGFVLTLQNKEGEKREFRLHEGEPEDMIFGRNLEGPKSLQDMIKLAYDAGKKGEKLIFKEEEEE